MPRSSHSQKSSSKSSRSSSSSHRSSRHSSSKRRSLFERSLPTLFLIALIVMVIIAIITFSMAYQSSSDDNNNQIADSSDSPSSAFSVARMLNAMKRNRRKKPQEEEEEEESDDEIEKEGVNDNDAEVAGDNKQKEQNQFRSSVRRRPHPPHHRSAADMVLIQRLKAELYQHKLSHAAGQTVDEKFVDDRLADLKITRDDEKTIKRSSSIPVTNIPTTLPPTTIPPSFLPEESDDSQTTRPSSTVASLVQSSSVRPSLPDISSLSYDWTLMQSPNGCSRPCGGGILDFLIFCYDRTSGKQVVDDRCLEELKPEAPSLRCNTQKCEEEIEKEKNMAVASDAEDEANVIELNIHTIPAREIDDKTINTTPLVNVVKEEHSSSSSSPLDELKKEGYDWALMEIGCTARCGGGKAIIDIFCYNENNGKKVADHYCDNAASAKPEMNSYPCNTAPCTNEIFQQSNDKVNISNTNINNNDNNSNSNNNSNTDSNNNNAALEEFMALDSSSRFSSVNEQTQSLSNTVPSSIDRVSPLNDNDKTSDKYQSQSFDDESNLKKLKEKERMNQQSANGDNRQSINSPSSSDNQSTNSQKAFSSNERNADNNNVDNLNESPRDFSSKSIVSDTNSL